MTAWMRNILTVDGRLLAATTSVGSVFPMCGAATSKARLPTDDSLTDGTTRRLALVEWCAFSSEMCGDIGQEMLYDWLEKSGKSHRIWNPGLGLVYTMQLSQWGYVVTVPRHCNSVSGSVFLEHTAAVKGSPYSITKLRVPDLLPVLASQVTWVINPAVGCHYFLPGLQFPLQPLRGLLPSLLLGEQRHNGCEQFY